MRQEEVRETNLRLIEVVKMGYVNEALIVGKLGADPQLIYTRNGMAVARLSVATHQKYQKMGKTIEETEWHRVVIFGRRAEIVQAELKKGGTIYVKGPKRTSIFTDASGQQRQRVEIIAVDIKFPGSEKLDMTAATLEPTNKGISSDAEKQSSAQNNKAAAGFTPTDKATTSEEEIGYSLDESKLDKEMQDLAQQ